MELLPLTYKDLTNVNDLPAKYKSIEGANFVDYNTVFGLRKSGLMNGLICKTIKAQTALLASSPAFREGTEVTSEEAANLAADVLAFVGGVSGMDPNGHLWYMQKAEIDGLGSGSNPKEIIWRGNKSDGTADYDFGLSQESDNFLQPFTEKDVSTLHRTLLTHSQWQTVILSKHQEAAIRQMILMQVVTHV